MREFRNISLSYIFFQDIQAPPPDIFQILSILGQEFSKKLVP